MHVKVRVKTEAKREEIVLKSKNSLVISLKEKPERNAANKKLVAVIGRHFSVPVSRVKIITGHKKPTKIVLIDEQWRARPIC
ncbi:MAG: DUF167 domain-containing protein [Patescibacteria group bacterium]